MNLHFYLMSESKSVTSTHTVLLHEVQLRIWLAVRMLGSIHYMW